MYPRQPQDGGTMGVNQFPTYARRWYMPTGVPVLAYDDGVVITSSQPSKGGYIVIEHAGGWQSQYMHLARRDKQVGAKVSAGEQIGIVGDDPTANDPRHLHFQLKYQGSVVDPAKYLQVATVKSWPLLGGANVPLLIGGAAAIVGGYWLIRRYA